MQVTLISDSTETLLEASYVLKSVSSPRWRYTSGKVLCVLSAERRYTARIDNEECGPCLVSHVDYSSYEDAKSKILEQRRCAPMDLVISDKNLERVAREIGYIWGYRLYVRKGFTGVAITRSGIGSVTNERVLVVSATLSAIYALYEKVQDLSLRDEN